MTLPVILLVDDNEDMRRTIRYGLEKENYKIIEAASAFEMMNILKQNRPDAILLDLMLPDENGLTMMGRIREQTDAPVIVVSGKGDLVDKVVGLEMGADDYVSKPFQIKELAARVKAHLRRHQKGVSKEEDIEGQEYCEKIKFGDWILDRTRLQVFDGHDRSANLSVKEFRLLEVFVISPSQVMSRDQLLDRSRLNEFNVTDRAIDTQITRIRKKLGDTADNGMIQSVRGAGYMFSGRVEPVSE